MPKAITHVYFAEEVKDRLRPETKDTLAANADAYRLGSIAPDAFYYSKIEKVTRISDFIHGKNGNPTNGIIFDLLAEHDHLNLAFTAGSITHCCLDMTLHPVIYYFSGNYYNEDECEEKNARYLHRLLETALAAKGNYKKKLSELIDLSQLEHLAYPDYISKKFNVSKKNIFNTFARQLFLEKLFYSRGAYSVLRFLGQIKLFKRTDMFGSFYGNLKKDSRGLADTFVYQDLISGEELSANTEDLFERARSLSAERIEAACDYAHGKIGLDECRNIIRGESLDTGKTGVPVYKIKFTSPMK